MNYLDIAFIVIAVLLAAVGCRRGFIVSVLQFAKTVVSIPLSMFVSSFSSEEIYNSYVKQQVVTELGKKISESSAQNFLNELSTSLSNVPLMPDDFQEKINLLNASGGEDLSLQLVDTLLQPMILLCVKIVVFAVCLIICSLVFGLIISLFSRRKDDEKKKLGSKINTLLGGAFGILKAAAIVFAVCLVLEASLGFAQENSEFSQFVLNSRVFTFVSGINPVSFIK